MTSEPSKPKERVFQFAIVTDDPDKVIKVLGENGYLPSLRSSTEQILEFFKGMVRPIAIIECVTAIVLLLAIGQEIPLALWAVGGGIFGEYGVERAVKRWKQT